MDKEKINIVAIDVGGSGGKMFLATYQNKAVKIIDEFAFENRQYFEGENMLVDIDTLVDNIVVGLNKFSGLCHIDSIGIDCWGGSYCWVDKKCNLIRKIYNCRSKRHHDNYYKIIKELDNYRLYKNCAVTFERHTLLSQLSYETNNNLIPDNDGDSFIILSSYLATVLTNKLINDVSAAVDTCMTDLTGKKWDFEKIDSFNIPRRVFNPIAEVGTLNGFVQNEKFRDSKFYGSKVINVAGHDTMSAVASIPNFGENDCFISIGTTIIVGAGTKEPITNKEAYEKAYKNCISLFNKNYICTDITGFWVANQVFNHFEVDGKKSNIVSMIEEASKVLENNSYINLCDDIFSGASEDMPALIQQECEKHGMKKPQGLGEIGLCIFESYALAIAKRIEDLLKVMKKDRFENIYVISGACRNKLLMQEIANAVGQPIYAGIPYATLLGNIMIQLVGNEIVSTSEELAEIACNTSELKEYVNDSKDIWNLKINNYKKHLGISEEN